ncbi:hypothetical protein [Bacteroides caecimuris]|uniref:hypothetical protein n=1 Tax=Bacteroides caecimuris TaxID=1796613 RepID=UPI00138F1064|nr:hypothetical protein [Bacteroides caecimuris]NDO59722.1 hypothetical protein [Bacteroides caecimuris]
MSKEIKCPQCKGDKVKRGIGEYKCLYCGMTFQIKQEVPKKDTETKNTDNNARTSQTPPPPVYIVNQPAEREDNSFAKGVAGGCAGVALWSILGPLIFLMILVASC